MNVVSAFSDTLLLLHDERIGFSVCVVANRSYLPGDFAACAAPNLKIIAGNFLGDVEARTRRSDRCQLIAEVAVHGFEPSWKLNDGLASPSRVAFPL